MARETSQRILLIIVISQFLGTSLWFAGNAVLADMAKELQLEVSFLGHLTSAVQLGFIVGTLVYAVLTIADRFSPSKVFFLSALLAAGFNLAMTIEGLTNVQLLLFRIATGFFLAGIYPVGMKIASDHFQKGLGKSLGFLVGALVLGTAFPHLIKGLSTDLPWKYVIYTTSALALLGGILILTLVPNGPYRRQSQKLALTAFFKVFKNKPFRASAFGYFGHMWELYAFWAFVPVAIQFYLSQTAQEANASLLSFLVIGIGGVSCAIGGLLSKHYPPKQIATVALALSGICCLLSPFVLWQSSFSTLLAFMLIWGMAVTADSPMFSTLVAQYAPETNRGTALTIVNCLGFSITILSIQLLNLLSYSIATPYLFLVLALGPVIGLNFFRKINRHVAK